jgi:hypothetical protein
MVENNRNSPSNNWFIVTQTLHAVYLPLYFMYTDDNILFMKPNLNAFWIALTLLVV